MNGLGIRTGLALLAAMAACTCALAQVSTVDPLLGYVCPAGGRQGTTVQIMVGGVRISRATDAVVSGRGVEARVLAAFPPTRPPDQEQRDALREALKAAMLQVQGGPPAELPTDDTLPRHPLVWALQDPTSEGIQRLIYEFFGVRPRVQVNSSIAETAVVELTIAANAPPGDRELRLVTPAGYSNPMYIQVSTSPEVLELEPNDPETPWQSAPVEVPVVFNGQIREGDVDRFRFRAEAGQNLVIRTQARRLVPYMADAVPGWFEAAIVLYDEAGAQVAYADCYRFDPDPVLFHEVKQSGTYTLEIFDSIYRGRQDFVYRVTVSEQPFATGIFPLGGPMGSATAAELVGWNLPQTRVTLDTSPDLRVREITAVGDQWLQAPVKYTVGTLPEQIEQEPNDTLAAARKIQPPVIINGRIDPPGDVDAWILMGRQGERIVIDVEARRLNSPLDSFVQVIDAFGNAVATNDDRQSPKIGLQTHFADSYLSVELPADNAYCVRLSDTAQHGGPDYSYRIRISEPQPDFSLYVNPSAVNTVRGRTDLIRLHAIRTDGLDGPIDLGLTGVAEGYVLAGAQIPAGRDQVTCTLTTPIDAPEGKSPLYIVGEAATPSGTIAKYAHPMDTWEQAFAYSHLVPAAEHLICIPQPNSRASVFRVYSAQPVPLVPGESTKVAFTTPAKALPPEVEFRLIEAPAGLSIRDSRFEVGTIILTLKADKKLDAPIDSAGNLIVQMWGTSRPRPQAGRPPAPPRQYAAGYLPAIRYMVTRG